ncbi:MAG: DEAD/DEAH box helicase family protein [Bacteroidota bacterium]
MKIQFDGSQDYQLAAVRSVVNIFEGQPLSKGDFEVSLSMEGASIAFTERGVGNRLVLSDEQLLENVRRVQAQNGIPQSSQLIEAQYDKGAVPFNFTVEMETGTGKTYTYLRSIYELHKVYGFKKFVIVVPSVAIREGTVKNLQITHEHFQNLYGKPPLNYIMYDSSKLTGLRNFAASNAIQILVINIDSFTKDNNIINTLRETGVKPIEYIQATRPIVIVDEPQNMETDVRKAAIHNLNPLCTLRYSATHRNLYNLVYSLNPVQAYDLGLVKQIEVDGITSDPNYNAPFIQYKGVTNEKNNYKAKIVIFVNEKDGVKQKEFKVGLGKKDNNDLYSLSGGRDVYDGYLLTTIDRQNGYIEFNNGVVIQEGGTQGGLTEDVIKFQIERTVKHHFEKFKKLKDKQIKVLSLFFIDRVANYRMYDESGQWIKGKFALWFEEAYKQEQKKYPDLIPFEAEKAHNGYFSSDKSGKGKDKKEVWTDTKGTTAKDDDTYNLIMKEKERLLGLEEPLQFIFSHSALREGWDNPNVFQICTLREIGTESERRQIIGRGLRLPVNAEGKRVQEKSDNVLTVITNETFADFAFSLQKEIESETSVDFKGRIKNAKEKATIRRSKELTLENFPILFEIWKRISTKTNYSVEYDLDALISRTVAILQDFTKVPKTKRPMLESRTGRIAITEDGVESQVKDTQVQYVAKVQYQLPDVYAYIQSRIDVSRNTIFQVLKQSGRIDELGINPQLFLDNLTNTIRSVLNSLLVDGVKYEQINGQQYEMRLFELEEIESYLSNLFKVSKTEKTVFNYIPIDSTIESDFARDCEADEAVKFFFKLPRGFKIPTPIGNYVPDWAVVLEMDGTPKVYFVAETKGTLDLQLVRELERLKIECGAKHFALFKPLDVEYKLAVKAKDLY